MKPLIGITAHLQKDKQNYYELYETYFKAVEKAGGIPVLIPFLSDLNDLDRFDGFLISGGGISVKYQKGENDLLPELKDQDPPRYAFEEKVLKNVVAKDIPVLGICRGMQMMNEVFGGTIFLSISSQIKDSFQHRQEGDRSKPSHKIAIDKSSKLFSIFGKEELEVNSIHRQSVKEPAPGFVVSARASDGVVEAIESKDHSFVVGLQFHPEKMEDGGEGYRKVFDDFIESCKK